MNLDTPQMCLRTLEVMGIACAPFVIGCLVFRLRRQTIASTLLFYAAGVTLLAGMMLFYAFAFSRTTPQAYTIRAEPLIYVGPSGYTIDHVLLPILLKTIWLPFGAFTSLALFGAFRKLCRTYNYLLEVGMLLGVLLAVAWTLFPCFFLENLLMKIPFGRKILA